MIKTFEKWFQNEFIYEMEFQNTEVQDVNIFLPYVL